MVRVLAAVEAPSRGLCCPHYWMDSATNPCFHKYMHERTHADDPRQQLTTLLLADFTPPDQNEPAPEGNALASLLTRARSVEGIDARFESEENVQLGETVAGLVEPAPVTLSFKAFVVHEIRAAHAWQSKVDEAVAPDRLGITSGRGIFDPALAKDIEAQALRGYAFDIAKRYTVAPDTDDETETSPLQLRASVRPSDYIEAVDRLYRWSDDFEGTYHEYAFEGIDPEAYRAAAPRADVISEEGTEQSGWASLVEQLRVLRKDMGKD